MLNILTNPNPILRQKSETIKDVNSAEIQALIPEMTETMLEKDGVGLAAPQIGKNIRLIVIRYKDDNIAMINPKIINKSLFKEWDEEGCLSFPHLFGDVKRYKKITVTYLDPSGKEHKLSGEGFLARVIQHEVDHLEGILFVDKARNLHKLEPDND